jgi:acetyltransferase
MSTPSVAKPATTKTQADVPAAPRRRPPLEAIFAPRSVAVIGATETSGSVGRTVLANLVATPFGGVIYPVNPKRRSVLGIQCHPRVADLPEPVDLAVIVTPARSVPGVIHECVDADVSGAIVISAGFKELGPEGVELEAQITAEARRRPGRLLRIIGPNCLGVMNPPLGLNATFAAGMGKPGNVAFLSQSGALCTAILDWSLRESVGFSGFVSTGSMLDVGWGDLIQYFGDDPHTKSILIYMESIGDARSFLSAAREVALSKPIIILKTGRTDAAARAAASHTGALVGTDAALDAALRRVGALRVDRISDLFYMAEVLAKQPRPRGPRLTILTNAGGPGVLATDTLIAGSGKLALLAPQTMAALDSFLPPHWSRGNPIDILGDANPERYAKALEAAARDPNSDGLLAIFTPQGMSDPAQTAERLRPYAKIEGKPVLASFMGGPAIEQAEQLLNQAGIPTFPYPDTAAHAFNYLWQYSSNLRALYETPSLPAGADENAATARRRAAEIISTVRSAGRTLLTEIESKQLLAAYGIPIVPTRPAGTADQAVQIATELGYPVVLKLLSQTITHKTDVGGVKLSLTCEAAVREAFQSIRDAVVQRRRGEQDFQGVSVQPMVNLSHAYEIILGSSIDPQFGPVILFGAGGQLVEIFKDRSLGLPPLNATLARRMMEQTRIYRALEGTRGRKPVDLPALEHLIVRFSHLIVEQPWIKEIDINPLLASPDGITALDARVVLHPSAIDEQQLPRPAIRPYPSQYVTEAKLKDGTVITVRPIRPEDEPLMVRFHQTLSDQSVQLRYFHSLKLDERIAHDRLSRVCFVDYDRGMALVAVHRDLKTNEPRIIGVGRLTKLHGGNRAEFALIVSDTWKNRGVGSLLLRQLLQIGRDEHLESIIADILPQNAEMQRVCRKLGFELRQNRDLSDPVRAQISL